MQKKEVENFLMTFPGYLKKSGINVLKRMWKGSPKNLLPKNEIELEKELKLVQSVMQAMRVASTITKDVEEDTLMDIYHQVLNKRDTPKKVLFYDLETSPNLCFSWRIGRDISLTHENIINERKIICVSFKWQGEDKIQSISWEHNDDKSLVEKFAKIINSADIVIGQNNKSFDDKWIRTRAIYHGIPLNCKFNSVDTLQMARSGFKFNSNKLDYLNKFLGGEGKLATGYDLWKKIVLDNDKQALKTMINYCENDIKILEEVYNRLQKYSPKKKFKYA